MSWGFNLIRKTLCRVCTEEFDSGEIWGRGGGAQSLARTSRSPMRVVTTHVPSSAIFGSALPTVTCCCLAPRGKRLNKTLKPWLYADPNSRATDIVLVLLFCIAVGTAIAWCGGRCEQCSADTIYLKILLFWRRPTSALVFRFGACFEVSLFCPPFPTRNGRRYQHALALCALLTGVMLKGLTLRKFMSDICVYICFMFAN